MDLDYPADAEAFRVELRAGLEANLPDDLRGVTVMTTEPGSPELQRLRTWNRTLADAGYAAIAWPTKYGGRGFSVCREPDASLISAGRRARRRCHGGPW